MKLSQLFRIRRIPTRRRTGFTLIEVMIGTAISGMIMLMVASLMLLSGRAIKDMYNKTRTRAAQMRALDQIRYRLMDASIASVAFNDGDDTDGYREVQFNDPAIGEDIISRFFFDADTNVLYYDDDMDDGQDNIDGFDDGNDQEGLAVAVGPIDVRFFPSNFNATIRLFIKSEAYIAAKLAEQEAVAEGEEPPPPVYTVVDEQEGETIVWLRNK